MGVKRVLGILILIIGILCIVFSNYISTQVEAGKGKIKNAQEKVDQGGRLFSLNPIAKEVGKGVTGGVQKKIDAGEFEIQRYEAIAGWLQIGGIILIVLGIFVIIFGGKKTGKSV